jgi:hypothetical protein
MHRSYGRGREVFVFRALNWHWRAGREVGTRGWILVSHSSAPFSTRVEAQRAAERAAKRRGWRR